MILWTFQKICHYWIMPALQLKIFPPVKEKPLVVKSHFIQDVYVVSLQFDPGPPLGGSPAPVDTRVEAIHMDKHLCDPCKMAETTCSPSICNLHLDFESRLRKHFDKFWRQFEGRLLCQTPPYLQGPPQSPGIKAPPSIHNRTGSEGPKMAETQVAELTCTESSTEVADNADQA
ncbi:Hypothetical predicted protein [Pelobates cultripes]|uniref:Uncharacterized protein n=1 Tax=Pelobates cultripes TaxID=61616 RepID=A0AAD1VSI2_PELCU|nr:Hypothetical predicted protein [Pelobates cultripes]